MIEYHSFSIILNQNNPLPSTGFCPPVLRAPGIGSEQLQHHLYLQERIDSHPQRDYWPLLHPFMTRRISNDTQDHPLNDFIHQHRQFWGTYKVTDVYMLLEKTPRIQNMERDSQRDWSLPLQFMPQFQRGSLESHRTGSWWNRRFMSDTRVQQIIGGIGFHQSRQLQRDSSRVLQTRRVHTRGTLQARGSWRVLGDRISPGGIRVRRGVLRVLVRSTWRDRVRRRYLRSLPADFRGSRTSHPDRDLLSPVKDLMNWRCSDLDRIGVIDTWPVKDIWLRAHLHTMEKLEVKLTGKSIIFLCFSS